MLDVNTAPNGCDIRPLRTRLQELTDVRRELASQVKQPPLPLLPLVAGIVTLGGIGAAVGGSLRTYGGGHGGRGGNIMMGLMLGGAIGAVAGQVISAATREKVDPARINPDIAILDARIAALNAQIVDCAVLGS